MASNVAFEILYREYYVRVFGLCRRLLGSPVAAEDAAQDVFVKAYRRFGSYDPSQPFWQWIAAVANHHCIDLLRRQRRMEDLAEDGELDVAAPDIDRPEAAFLSDRDASEVNHAISLLPDRYRVPLVLAYFADASYEEIAGQLGISSSHVGVLLLRARQKLRLLVEEPGGQTS